MLDTRLSEFCFGSLFVFAPFHIFESPLFVARCAMRVGECWVPPMQTHIVWVAKALLLEPNLHEFADQSQCFSFSRHSQRDFCMVGYGKQHQKYECKTAQKTVKDRTKNSVRSREKNSVRPHEKHCMNERPREKLNFSTPKREFFKHVL